MRLKLGLGLYGDVGKFAPNRLNGLELWLDAADTSTITTGATFTWADKSGNGNDATQTTGANQPATGTRTINGLNALDFDVDSLELPSAINDIPTSGNTVFVVALLDNLASSASGYRLFSATTGGGSTRWGIILNRSATDQIEFVNSNGGFSPLTVSETLDNNAHIFAQSHEGTALNGYYDGEESTGSSANVMEALNNTFIGSANNSNGFFDGLIGEVIMFNRELADTEKNKVGNYLSSKWGISWANI